VAADLPVPLYSEVPQTYGAAPPPVFEDLAPPIVVRRPIVVAPPVVFDEYPVYAAPRVYAYAGPVCRGGWGWGHRHHFHGGW